MDLEKANNLNISVGDVEKPGTDIADLEKADGIKADKADTDGVNKSGTSIANLAKIDKIEANRTDKSNIDPADLAKADGADK